MRLKVNGDTFFLPSTDGSVYFRNNIGSFRMEGSTIDQWIEKLMPVFNGGHTMHDLTDGLPEQYRERVYEIAKVLYANGYVRDVSRDRQHQLQDGVLKNYASQIEFLDSFDGSGAYRFQLYRQSSVLAAGSGSFLVSLMKCLLESGLPHIRMLITDPETTNRNRILELAERARRTDPEVKLDEISLPNEGSIDWRSVVQPYDAILFVSDENGESDLRALHEICRKEKKVLLPALIMGQAGLAGPFVHPDSEGCWESAWRRVHHSVIDKDPLLHAASSTAESMLANVIVFEWLKSVTEVTASEMHNKLFLLNLETLEGNWHPFFPHPLASGRPAAERKEELELLLDSETGEIGLKKDLLPYFSRLTSSEMGIFHAWGEGDLRQLPLSQCRVQAADPLSAGPSALLPEIVCNGLNHEEARKEAGLAGIEAYVSRMAGLIINDVHKGSSGPEEPPQHEFVGIGAGETIAEGIGRGLQKCLTEVMVRSHDVQSPSVNPVQIRKIDDKRCHYYLSALTTMQVAPTIGFGEDVLGFPVAWVCSSGRWFGAVDFNRTRALRRALQQTLLYTQNKEAGFGSNERSWSSVNLNEAAMKSVSIPACDPLEHREVLKSALQQLKRFRKRLLVYNLASEAFLKEELAGAFGVLLREEDGQ
ncbi:putative thiazole-containing bacteriocin maturation protein [Paenibacillus sp. sgz302251]|uniref:putative thiazole-containing bacteriocin maturation protein n=1 Tax=Paenibacillus sp. sgz302251 TaxID=3414493 RepID=UPI003C7EBD7A